MPDEQKPEVIEPMPAPMAIAKFRGVQHELEQLYKVCNGEGNKTLAERVGSAYAFLWLGISFLDGYKEDKEVDEFIADLEAEMEAHPYPTIVRSVIKTADGFLVIRLQPVRLPTSGDTMRNDVLPQYQVQGEALVVAEILRDFYLHHVHRWVQSMAVHLMKRDVLRRYSRTVQRFSQYFASRPDMTAETEEPEAEEGEPIDVEEGEGEDVGEG